MAIIRTLKSFLGRTLYPKTVTKAIYEGTNRLDHMLQNGVCNPNLLINTDFANPVNQRGFLSGDRASNNTFVVDRWEVTTSASTAPTVEFTEGAVKINAKSGGSTSLRQTVEFPQSYAGRTLTISARYKVSSGGSLSLACSFGGSSPTSRKLLTCDGEWHTDSLTFIVPSGVVYLRPQVLTGSISSDEVVYVKDLKLEHGELATPFIPKRYDEELRDCMRFYQKFRARGSLILGLGNSDSATVFYPRLTLPVPMRVSPTVSFSGEPFAYPGSYSSNAISKMANGGASGSKDVSNIEIACTTVGLTANSLYAIRIDTSGAYIDFNAEL